MGPAQRPLHLLFFDESSADHLIDRRLHECLENHVLNQVGSYGKQLGKIISVLDVLVAHLPQNELTPQEQIALREFRQLSEQVKGAVATIKGPQQKSITQADVDQLIENLQSLAGSNPKAHRRLVDQLKTAIAAEDKRKVGNHDVSGV